VGKNGEGIDASPEDEATSLLLQGGQGAPKKREKRGTDTEKKGSVTGGVASLVIGTSTRGRSGIYSI